MRRSLLLPPLSIVIALLAGCGNKGPLVLPPAKPTPAASAPAPAMPATATSSSATPSTGQH